MSMGGGGGGEKCAASETAEIRCTPSSTPRPKRAAHQTTPQPEQVPSVPPAPPLDRGGDNRSVSSTSMGEGATLHGGATLSVSVPLFNSRSASENSGSSVNATIRSFAGHKTTSGSSAVDRRVSGSASAELATTEGSTSVDDEQIVAVDRGRISVDEDNVSNTHSPRAGGIEEEKEEEEAKRVSSGDDRGNRAEDSELGLVRMQTKGDISVSGVTRESSVDLLGVPERGRAGGGTSRHDGGLQIERGVFEAGGGGQKGDGNGYGKGQGFKRKRPADKQVRTASAIEVWRGIT